MNRNRIAVTLSLALIALAAMAATRDFNNPARTTNDTAQQFTAVNVHRDDTPNDPSYDRAELDDPDGRTAFNLYDERFDLFGWASRLTPEAIYLDHVDPTKIGKAQISGFNASGAWKQSRGRPEVVIAILDTGIRWHNRGLRTQVHLNTRELPLPQDASGATLAPSALNLNGYDRNNNGAVDVDDYANDARVNRNTGDGVGDLVDGGDLIAAFSNNDDADLNGFVDDIAGWDFFNNDNDPYDQSSYFAAGNHGTGRVEEAVERANDGDGELGVCPQCQFMPLRIWDTFVADANTFGMSVLYASDNGASVIEGANGALAHTAFMEAASQYAYDQGLVQTYSGDDLNTGNHNYPANYSHAMLIEGTVTDTFGLGENPSDSCDPNPQFPRPLVTACQQAAAAMLGLPEGVELPVRTYFRSANTAQFGGKSSVSMIGATGSVNTGKASGAAGMVISAALDAGIALRPDETREILEQTAEDILAANTPGTGVPDPAQPGWDIHFGYGRVDLGKAVAVAASGKIPPEAAIYTPDWYAPLTGNSLNITGLARARFATGGSFTWRLEWGVGLAPTAFTLANSGSSTGTVTNFGSIDLNAVRAAIAAAPPAPDSADAVFSPTAPNPYKQQFAVRLVVTDAGIPTLGMDRRVFTTFNDATLRAGYPRRLGTGGEAPLRYADINGDGVTELIVPTMDGVLRVLKPDGTDFPGFPVQTRIQHQALNHGAAPGFAALAATPPREALRGAAVADLDDDGTLEIIDTAGIHVYVWKPDGSMRPGFPVTMGTPAGGFDTFCKPQTGSHQEQIHPKCGFISSPAVGRLEGANQPLNIVAAGLDGYLYAWRHNGSLVPGFPVRLADTREGGNMQLAESINNPAIGDLNNDGRDDVVVATHETYAPKNPTPSTGTGPGAVFADALARAAGGSSRMYAVNGATGAYLPGWPIVLNGAIQDILPLIGPGHDAALARINGTQSVIVSTTGGALLVYGVNGALIRDMQQNTYGAASNATDDSGTISLFEYATVGDVTGSGQLAVVKYLLTLNQVVNLLLVGQNQPYNHLIGAWDATTGAPLPAFPTITDDYQLLTSSSIGKVVAGTSNQILSGTGLGLLHAYDGATGQDVAGFPKQTGGWLFVPTELSNDQRIAAITREGYLFEWNVPGAPSCQPEWPTFRHDPHNSGNYNKDGTRPNAPKQLTAAVAGATATFNFTAPGDDGDCGRADLYALRILNEHVPADWKNAIVPAGGVTLPMRPLPAAGSSQSASLSGLATGRYTVLLRAYDEAGNGSAVASVFITVGNPPPLFSFVVRNGVATNVFITSEAVTLSGFTGLLPVRIDSGGQYSIAGGAYVTSGGSIAAGQTLRVRHVSAPTINTEKISNVTVGTYSAPFKTVTSSVDRTPEPFGFGTQTNLVAGATATSEPQTLSGFNTGISIIPGPGISYRINQTGLYVTSSGTLQLGQSLQVQHTASSNHLEYTKTYLKVGGVVGYFTTRTQ